MNVEIKMDNINRKITKNSLIGGPGADSNYLNKNDKFINYRIVGGNYGFGGIIKQDSARFSGFIINKPSSPLFKNTKLNYGDTLLLHADIYNGAPIKSLDKNGIPIIDNEKIEFYKTELLGYFPTTYLDQKAYGMFYILQKTRTSGYIISIGARDWLKLDILNKKEITQITLNAIDILSTSKNPFTN
jgi:hypothetical protein